jgi:hypothetical protein
MSSLPLVIPDKEIQSDHDVAGYELICELRKTPTVLYGIFVEIVRQFYMNNDPMLKGVPKVRWDVDPQKTDIWIDTELRWEDEHPEFRPAIFVKLGDIQYGSLPIIGSKGPLQLKDAVYHYADQGSSTVTFIHVGNTSGEACSLCDNTEQFLTTFKTQIADDFCFTSFDKAQRSPIAQSTKESKERYMSSVTFNFSFEETWSVKLESPILKSVKIYTGQEPKYSGIISRELRSPELI